MPIAFMPNSCKQNYELRDTASDPEELENHKNFGWNLCLGQVGSILDLKVEQSQDAKSENP